MIKDRNPQQLEMFMAAMRNNVESFHDAMTHFDDDVTQKLAKLMSNFNRNEPNNIEPGGEKKVYESCVELL